MTQLYLRFTIIFLIFVIIAVLIQLLPNAKPNGIMFKVWWTFFCYFFKVDLFPAEDYKMVITSFPPFWVQSSPKSNFLHENNIFPHLHCHQNRQFSFSTNFRQTQKLNNSSTIYCYKEYFLKVHLSNFRNGGKLNFRGGTSFRKWVMTLYFQQTATAELQRPVIQIDDDGPVETVSNYQTFEQMHAKCFIDTDVQFADTLRR